MEPRCHEHCKFPIAPISSQVTPPHPRIPVLLPYAEDPKLQELLSEWYLAGFYRGWKEGREGRKERSREQI